MVYETRMAAFEKERAIAEAAAREAGAIVKRYYDKPIDEVAKRDKGAGREENWLTQADSESDDLLKERLLGAFPDDGWLSEETADSAERLEKDARLDRRSARRDTRVHARTCRSSASASRSSRRDGPSSASSTIPPTDRLYSAVARRGHDDERRARARQQDRARGAGAGAGEPLGGQARRVGSRSSSTATSC